MSVSKTNFDASTWDYDSNPGAQRLQPICALVALVLAIGAMFMPWVVAGGAGNVGTRSAFAIPVVNVILTVLMLAAVVGVLMGMITRSSSRLLVAVPLSLALLPGVATIVAAEALRSVLPTWATPIVTNSDIVTLRGGSGVWLFSGLAAVALALVLMPAGSLSATSRTAQVLLGARGAVAITTLLVITLRAQPFYRFSTSADVIDGTDPIGFRIGIQIGDIPALGTVSLMGVIAITGAAGWILVRPHPVALIMAGTGAMIYLVSVWAAEVVRRIASLVVPSGWSPFDEADGAVAMSLTPALGLSVLATMLLLAAVAACSWPVPSDQWRTTPSFIVASSASDLPGPADDLP